MSVLQYVYCLQSKFSKLESQVQNWKTKIELIIQHVCAESTKVLQ